MMRKPNAFPTGVTGCIFLFSIFSIAFPVGNGFKVCPLALSGDINEASSSFNFDFFSTTVLSEKGGLFSGTYAGRDEESIFEFTGNCSHGFSLSEMVRGSEFPNGVTLGGPSPPGTSIFLSATNITLPNTDTQEEIYFVEKNGVAGITTLVSERVVTQWGRFHSLGKPHYGNKRGVCIFPGEVGDVKGLYGGWLAEDGELIVRALVNTTTLVPGSTFQRFKFLDYPTLDDDGLVFFGSSSYPAKPALYFSNISNIENETLAALRALVTSESHLPAPFHDEKYVAFAEPALSGKKVVFLAQGSGGTKGIFMVDVDSLEVTTVAHTGKQFYDLRMPPAVYGSNVAFHATRVDYKSTIIVQNDLQCGGAYREVVSEGQLLNGQKLLYVLFYKYEINGDGMVFYGVLEDGSFGLFWVELTDDDCGSALSPPIQILEDTTVNTITAADVQ
mmetsp:Transcript_45099/g.75247  ORF Transcript_45099/g.75247 Transcript_45099/m.75247 type:complete len:445 (+) Transcript_45099:33-1367(+)|eukprot:CAMPEP_0198199562 /NCGR_PEP_ID=MMETSP1445-20131203/2829_1 /TAXON_ID=36898 /ORGANISM="Pyramimonas sp., Strain CCMP2087" /LENGTH=444 /DNA_ID=CAMNT_0043869439 /DNA_START=30 /DNA_END=1364 /DNA_ORIENTATION=-